MQITVREIESAYIAAYHAAYAESPKFCTMKSWGELTTHERSYLIRFADSIVLRGE